ncbi:30S ribosomal protein S4 [candidate division WOR-3 bacterium]|nr:30S ribosomal protein S4 [candidate division WOR-3 bacterium]
MARDIGPKCKRCRRTREKLFLRGDKCVSDKCVLMRRGEEPAARTRRRVSPYSIQLREKQKLRMMYGLLEAQFRNYFEKAVKSKNTAAALLISLERRLDNVVFRLGFASSRPQARQFVRHGHIAVSGRRTDIPSYAVKAGQTVTPAGEPGRKAVTTVLANKDSSTVPWLSVDTGQATGTVVRLPTAEDVKDVPCNTQLIVELYSK